MSRIFVVEDDAIIAQDITFTLQRLGYDIAGQARSGVEAIVSIEQERPDLVLMDIKLGGRLDGIQTTATIRKRWDVPVIYLTAHSDDATLARAKETAPHGYLLKPFNERDLRTAIEVALRKHELELKLAERERWFSTTLESIGDAVIATDPDQRITFMNAVAEKATGWRKNDARGKRIDEIFTVVEGSSPPHGGEAGFKVELPLGTRLVDRGGLTKDVDDSVAPILDGNGNVLGSVVVFRDITERRALEQRVVAAERLASISTMAAGMAHEINTPLAATVANVEFALRRLNEVKDELAPAETSGLARAALLEVIDALVDANIAGGRLRKIVSDLKKFTRADDTSHELLDLPNIIDSAIKLTSHELGPAAQVVRTYGTTPLVSIAEGKLIQVISNLIINASQAGARRIDIITMTNDAGRAVITLKDDGGGIPLDVLPRIFDPFFTTKPIGKGLGLGLALSHSIVTTAGGTLSAESTPEVGSTFTLTFPGVATLSQPPRPPSVAPPGVRRGHVLLIDDEETVGRTVQRVLQDLHEIVFETSARAALARIQGGEHFDAILCDLTMPDLDGIGFFQTLVGLDAELASKVVFVTGGVTSERANTFLENCANIVVFKPFTMNRLRAVVNSLVK